jgi:fibronectin type 3 domain-containing protein
MRKIVSIFTMQSKTLCMPISPISILHLASCVLCLTSYALYLASPALAEEQAAVESIGEINAKDNSTGTVIAGTTADLVLTLIADMSQAEPGEEIASIQITVPSGFSAKENAVKSLKMGEASIPDFQSVVDRNRIIVTLPMLITLTTIVEIEFVIDAPPTPVPDRLFIVGLMNILQNPILISIKAGNADGRVNNDRLAVKVVAATKPQAPSDLSVRPDPSGENDLIISWTKSDDPLVSGYLIYRSDKGDEPVADVTSREQTSYIDRSLEAGKEYSYTIRSYKTRTLKSDASNTASAVATPDTKAPIPPAIQMELIVTEKGIEIAWEASSSQDIVKYVIYRGSSLGSLEPIDEVDADRSSYMDESPPEAGSYLYVIGAVDDAGNEAKSSETQTRHVIAGAEPQPNPFTPLSADMVEGGEGVFAVKIYDMEGDLVFENEAVEGAKEIRWDGKDTDGEYVASGIYVYQATMGDKYKLGAIVVAK